ncbi:MAG: hypothetical protein DBX59_09210 [Bacillota bacterium]|nr:MAG: hypothetical protein DBX59_09210 [Bacillota bacterium]
MTVEEASRRFDIEQEEINSYIREGYILKSDEDLDEYDFQNIGIIRTLLQFNISGTDLCRYLNLEKKKNRTSDNEQIRLLRNARTKMLDEIHEKQKILDRIDYFIYEIRKRGNE